VSSAAWKAIVGDNPVNKSIGESTNFDLDATGHYKELDEERSDEENFDPKPLSRLTLQVKFNKDMTQSNIYHREQIQ
jgi:CRISPR/Cas system CMR subunit Cmr6 (Cas7 group RAMP superfamily)